MDLAGLRSRVRGTVVAEGDATYARRRAELLWNGLRPDRRPAAIVRVADAADVVETVRWARANGLRIGVRTGGHTWWGAALTDGTVTVDLGGLTGIALDARRRTATVEPGVTNHDLAVHLAAHDLAFPFGHCPQVTMGGYLLAGGNGWNAAAWGAACASVDAVDVVLADGTSLHARADEHPDLLWAARGAGVGFPGVVTRFAVRLHPLPGAITTRRYVHRLERARELAAWAATVARRLPPTVELALALGTAPDDVDAGCRSDDGRACIVLATAFAADPAEAAAALAPFEDSPLVDGCHASTDQPTPFRALFEGVAARYPETHRMCADAWWTDRPLDAVVGRVADHVGRAPSAGALALVTASAPPAVGRADPPGTAFAPAAPTFVATYAVWPDPAGDDANRAWHREALGIGDDLAAGFYLGETDAGADPSRARRAFTPATWARLAEVRRRYDPDEVFPGFPA